MWAMHHHAEPVLRGLPASPGGAPARPRHEAFMAILCRVVMGVHAVNLRGASPVQYAVLTTGRHHAFAVCVCARCGSLYGPQIGTPAAFLGTGRQQLSHEKLTNSTEPLRLPHRHPAHVDLAGRRRRPHASRLAVQVWSQGEPQTPRVRQGGRLRLKGAHS